jgi:alkylated DNA nucleotide flippase Atl1
LAPTEPRPARALALLDSLLDGQLGADVYLTAVHGRLRAHEGGACVRLSLGGHGQPLVVRRDGRVEPVGQPGSAISLTGDPQLTDVDVPLRPGDALVLTTDGVAEARAGGEFFGEAGLVACLERRAGADADDLAQGLLDEVLAYQAGDAADDVAVLVLQVPSGQVSTALDCTLARGVVRGRRSVSSPARQLSGWSSLRWRAARRRCSSTRRRSWAWNSGSSSGPRAGGADGRAPPGRGPRLPPRGRAARACGDRPASR